MSPKPELSFPGGISMAVGGLCTLRVPEPAAASSGMLAGCS
jgi:hypothetical protein